MGSTGSTGAGQVQGNSHVGISNVGPIASGDLALRSLNVFVGKGNTGKSMLATLIYALHNFFKHSGEFGAHTSLINSESIGNLSESEIRALVSDVEKSLNDAQREASSSGGRKFRVDLPRKLIRLATAIFDEQSSLFSREIERCFSVKLRELVRYRSRTPSEIRVSSQAGDERFGFNYDVKQGKLACICPTEFSITIDQQRFLHLKRDTRKLYELMSSKPDKLTYLFDFIDLISGFTEQLTERLLGSLRDDVHYLPADRAGMMHAHTVVAVSLVKAASMVGLRPDFERPILTGVVADFLEELILPDRSGMFTNGPRSFRSPTRGIETIASDIEKVLLEGSIRVDRGGFTDYPRIEYIPNGWKKSLPLKNASATVSELAPVVMFLRECVAKTDLLIVEEPEAHLHPALQVALTRILAMLVKSDVRVLLTTHSEWILDELSNIVIRSRLKIVRHEERPDRLRYVSLKPSEVGVWLFEHSNGSRKSSGSHVAEIKPDEETGLYPSGFDDVAIALHNEWAETFNLQDAK